MNTGDFAGDTVEAWWAPGRGASKCSRPSPWEISPSSLAVGRFGGDGPTDLAVANFGDGTVGLLLSTAAGG